MSATTSSSGKRAGMNGSQSSRTAVAGLRSSSPNHRSSSPRPTAKEKNDEVNRKLDYLLKKTRKLEDTLSSVRTENVSLVAENKKTQECTVNMWESIKKDRESTSYLRGEVSSLRTKLDLLNQKTTLLESSPNNGGVKMEEIGLISEQVFGRVHREFSTVVDEVVRACVKEQVDFLAKWTAKGGLEKDALLLEENKHIRSQISILHRKQEEVENSLHDMEEASDAFRATQTVAISDASTATSAETQHLLESITKRLNDTVTFAISNFQEEMATKYDGTMHQLINSCNDLQVRIAESEDQMVNVDASIADSKEHADVEIANLSSIVSMTKETVQQLEDNLEEVKEEVEEEKRRRKGSEKQEREREQQGPQFPPAVKQDQDAVLESVHEHLHQQDENLSSYLQLLEEHRSDYTETISRLSTAGRQTKSAYGDLVEQVNILKETQSVTDDEVLRMSRQCEEDRTAVGRLSKDNNKLATALAECQKGLASKKNKKKGSEENEKVFLGASQMQEVTNLKERMDIFEESVIDTVQEMIETQHAEALAPLEKRLDGVERRQEKYGELVTERVDSFHSAEVIPLVGSIHKVERLVESMAVKLGRGAGGGGGEVIPPVPETLTPPRASQQSTRATTSPAATDLFQSSKLTSDQLSSSSFPSSSTSLKPSFHPGASTVPLANNLHDVKRRSTSSERGSVFPGSQHSTSSLENTHTATSGTSPASDIAHKPKYHPPQSFNLTNTLSSAHEIMPATDIPHLSTLPDLRKSQKKEQQQPQQQQQQQQQHSYLPQHQHQKNPQAQASIQDPRRLEEPDFRPPPDEDITGRSHSVSHNNNQNNRQNNSQVDNSYPVTSTLTLSASQLPTSSPGILPAETILKTLQDKKQKHRKKFQSLVKNDMNVPES